MPLSEFTIGFKSPESWLVAPHCINHSYAVINKHLFVTF